MTGIAFTVSKRWNRAAEESRRAGCSGRANTATDPFQCLCRGVVRQEHSRPAGGGNSNNSFMKQGDIVVFGQADEGAMVQARVCANTADYVALMADNHKGYAVPIGGVLAYKNAISPSGVGFDMA